MNIVTEIVGRLLAITLVPWFTLRRALGSGFKKTSEIWLIGENQGECLEDNGFAFYLYCRALHPNSCIYFLIKKSSPFYETHFFGDSHAVLYGSVRHMRLFVEANIYFYTHTYRDLIYRRTFERFGYGKKLVYLHHGTLGFKKFDAFYHRNRNIMDIFTVGSEFERQILVNQAGIDAHRVRVTGYARWDFLQKAAPTESQILYMPTHRRHLDSRERREFVARLAGLLANPQLTGLLEQHDLRLKVYLHAHTQKTLSVDMDLHRRIELVGMGQVRVKDLLTNSRIMITDYSSVSWDFRSLAKPVLFYRYDIESYINARESYIDLKDETFGKIAYNEEQLIALLSQYLNGQHRLDPGNDPIQAMIGTGDNGTNCRKIYDLVEATWGAPSGANAGRSRH